MRRLALVLAVALAVALAAAAVARADGDPASDFLLTQKVFFNPEETPKAQQRALAAVVTSANANGYPIRVAVIGSDYDLGAVTSLWHRPRRYARFLSAELTYYYKGRLLIVMPNGFGFAWPGHDTAAEQAALASIPIGKTQAALGQAGVQAVQQLAAAAGVKVATAGSGTSSANSDRLKIVIGVLLLVVLGAAARLVIRRRASG